MRKSSPANPTENTRWYCQPGRPGHERLWSLVDTTTTATITPIKATSS